MGWLKDFGVQSLAFIIGWSIAILMLAHGIDGIFNTDFVILLSKIPLIGLIFLYPMYSLVLVAAIFVLMYRGNAIPKFFMSMWKPKT